MSDDVQSGLEGVVAFATEIAEPDREGGALRYRGVDIEELVGSVPYERVWGVLVDGSFGPRARPPGRRAGGAGVAGGGGKGVRLPAPHRHRRRAGARRPRARVGHGPE